MSTEVFVNAVVLLLIVSFTIWRLYENWWKIKRELPSFWCNLKNGWKRLTWKFRLALVALPICFLLFNTFAGASGILKIFALVLMPVCFLLMVYILANERQLSADRKEQNRETMEKGYGFLLSREEREEVLRDGDVEILKPLQKPKIIKGYPAEGLTVEGALRAYAKMINTHKIDEFEKILSDDFCYEAQTVIEPLNSKQKYMDYIIPKLKAISSSQQPVFAEMGSVVAYKGKEEPCVILAQPSKDDLQAVVLAEVNADKLVRLNLCIVPRSQSAIRTGEYPS